MYKKVTEQVAKELKLPLEKVEMQAAELEVYPLTEENLLRELKAALTQ
jgi:hypothetical protein